MIDAKAAFSITRRVLDDEIYKAKQLINLKHSGGWIILERRISDVAGYELIIHERDLLSPFTDNNYWTKDRVHRTLLDLGYEVNFSFSSNPENERWTISWQSAG